MTDHKATSGQWEALEEHSWQDAYSCTLELRARVEALEVAIKPAESNYPELPNSSLVDLVTLQIDNGTACNRESAGIARYAILEVAAWVDHLGYHSCAAELRKEIPQSC